MRPNIDLTLNRDFRKSGKRVGIFLRKDAYPWHFRDSINEGELVLTGSKIERANKIKGIKYTEGTFCECCGIDLSKKPWYNGNIGLCYNCDDSLQKRLNKKNPSILNLLNSK